MTTEKDSTDVLLWLGAAVLAGVAVTWLAVSRPWAQDDPLPMAQALSLADRDNTAADDAPGEELDADTQAGGTKAAGIDGPEATLDSPLRMAELAVRAGMLLEPEGYSAWSLYQQALRRQPGNAAANDGLHTVADLLMNRAGVAIEQSRTADAIRLIETVRAAIPDHPEATRLAGELNLGQTSDSPPAAPAQVAEAEAAPAREPRQPKLRPTANVEQPKITATARLSKPAPAARPSAPARSDFEDAAKAFETALAAGKLLAPEDASARHHLLQMAELRPNDQRTTTARKTLTEALLSRADESIDALDTLGADVWLTQAEQLGADPLRTESARLKLDQRIIDRDAARPIPVSELNVLNYVPPRYPSRAVERNIEGWVDLEFTVNLDGQPRDITVLDASHERYFRTEAVDAVSQWSFEPRVVRGTTVAQRTSARITFKLE